MFKRQPYKLVCPKCGYSKMVHPESDVIGLEDVDRECHKCGTIMKTDSNIYKHTKEIK